ncbi:alpha/beta fold hydrolase [Nocardia sp. ET3-3]|uniref:Alpha/beta fold hydrolase n=1 Tax=Nocardia terrae TaxID=2675851 RepID=A0A7K1V6S4_9NOCA|nr:alpha/beta hydrolase [Nocardia terrae]MVU82345.1 alpha/beta fold hydrolase [Nocardia terrae]
MDALQRWRSGGQVIDVTISGTVRRIFVRTVGTGTPLLLLHGYPSSSFEWADIEPYLAPHHMVVSFDFLGFGASEKPARYRYSIIEQADLVETLCTALGLTEVTLVAYDYGAIVATELLARRTRCAVSISRCILLNAGLYADKYRPRLAQRALLIPVLGALLARAFSERVFIRAWNEVFSPEHRLDPDVARLHYRALRENDPDGDIHRKLLRYIPERIAHATRWEDALTRTDVPMSYLWGMADPVSGRAIADELRHRHPEADLVEHADAGHCPHMEIPEHIAADLLRRTIGTPR